MTVKEARKLIAVMMVAYPNYKPIDTELTAATWAEMLSDYSYEQVSVALKRYMASEDKGFAPSIGQIISKITVPTGTPELTEMEAWSMVRRAIGNGIYHSNEEFEKLPPAVQRAVGSAEQLHTWAVDEKYNEPVIMSHVINAYKRAAEQEKELAKLPENVRALLQNTARTLAVD